jgi:hypothetical protein
VKQKIEKMKMDKDSKFALLVIGLPFVGLLYCGIIIMSMILVPEVREHPVIAATIFAVGPSLISGSIWLFSSFKSRNKERLGL